MSRGPRMAATRGWLILASVTLLLAARGTFPAPQTGPQPAPEVLAILMRARAEPDVSKSRPLYEQALAKARELKDRKGEADALRGMGAVLANNNLNAEGFALFEQSLPISRAIGDQAGAASTIVNMAIVHGKLGRLPEALAAYREALPMVRELGQLDREGVILNNSASIHARMGRLADAVDELILAAAAFERFGDPLQQAGALLAQTSYLERIGRAEEGIVRAGEALGIYRELGDRGGQAQALNAIGVVCIYSGQPSRAIAPLIEVLAIFKGMGSTRQGDILTNLGNAHRDLGDHRKALDCYQQALPFHRAGRNSGGEAITLSGVASIRQSEGKLQDALDLNLQALKLIKEHGAPGSIASQLHQIAGIYLELGDRQLARRYLEEALPLHRASGNLSYEANSRIGLGNVLSESGDVAGALYQYEQARSLRRAAGSKTGEAIADLTIATLLIRQGMHQQALDRARAALVGLDGAEPPAMRITLRTIIASCLMRTGSPAEAVREFEEILKQRESMEQGLLVTVIQHSAYALGAAGRLREAIARISEAIQIHENVRSDLGGFSQSRESLVAYRMPSYYLAVRLALQAAETSAAFQFAQMTKSRNLMDLMDSERVDLSSKLAPGERERIRSLQQRAALLNQGMVREGVENEVGSRKRYAALKEELQKVDLELRAFQDSLYAGFPDRNARRTATPASLGQVASALPSDTLLLDFVVLANGRVIVFAVRNNGPASRGVLVYDAGAKYDRLKVDAGALRAACADPRKDPRAVAARLGKALLTGAASRLKGARRIILCPNEALWDIPFAVLPTSSAKGAPPLGEAFEVVYAYSATAAIASQRASKERKPASRSILVAANPAFGSSNRFGSLHDISGQRPIENASRPLSAPSRPFEAASRPFDSPSRPLVSPSRPLVSPSRPLVSPSRPLVSPSRPLDLPSRALEAVSRGGKEIPALKGTQREADALRRLFPGATVLTGASAQEAAIKQRLGSYRYLHLATHGFVNDGSPLLSSVVLAKPTATSGEDGFLTAREIYSLNLSAEMTVLSACNTARGENRTGEGIVGLTWALFVAGCPTQVVSQWAVDDASTALLMGRFYENLAKRKMTKSGALKEASLWLRGRGKKYQHPYYWAPFVLNGAWQ